MTTVSAPTWDGVRRQLAAALATLPDGGFVVLGEPTPERPRAKGLRGRLGGHDAPVPTRFVQARRDADQLGAECVGASAFGGPLEIRPDQDARLRALGWLAPGDAAYDALGGPAYRRWVPVAEGGTAAALLIASLEVLGVEPSGPLDLTAGS